MLRRVQETYGRTHGVKLLPNCLPDILHEVSPQPALPERFRPYVNRFRLICLTRYYAHKNLEIIVETFKRHKDCLRDVVVFLTIPCEQERESRWLLRAIDRFGLNDQIVNLGAIEQADVPNYFRNCHALLLPTLLESFSTTYLEAMHCGLPIMTSDLDFARDVCGEAALYFDPWSPSSVAEAIMRLRADSKLRSELAEAGRRQLADIHNQSWDDIAEVVISDLRSIICRTG
jgi:glycosyltransferase involved in cell wall biosynthesis